VALPEMIFTKITIAEQNKRRYVKFNPNQTTTMNNTDENSFIP